MIPHIFPYPKLGYAIFFLGSHTSFLGFPVVPPVPVPCDQRCFHSWCHSPPAIGWENHGRLEKTPWRILLTVPAPIGTREALGAARLNLVQKGLALKSWKPFKKGMFVYKNLNPVLWFSMFAYKNKLYFACALGGSLFLQPFKKEKWRVRWGIPMKTAHIWLSDTCLRSNLSPTIQNSRLIHPYLATTALFLPKDQGFKQRIRMTLKLTWRFGWDVGWNWKLQMLVIPLLFDSPKQRPLFIT